MGWQQAHRHCQQQQQSQQSQPPTLLLVVLVLLGSISTPESASSSADDDLYARLGLSSSADAREIKKAYRSLSLEWHPDKAAARGVDPELAQEEFVEVARAYETLSDQDLRRAYDRERAQPARQRGAAAPNRDPADVPLRRDRAAGARHAAFKAARLREWEVKLDWAARMFNELFPDGHAEVGKGQQQQRQQQWAGAGAGAMPTLQGFFGSADGGDAFGFSFMLDIGSGGGGAGMADARQREASAAGNTHWTAAEDHPSPSPMFSRPASVLRKESAQPAPDPPPPPPRQADLKELLEKEKQDLLSRRNHISPRLRPTSKRSGGGGNNAGAAATTAGDGKTWTVGDRSGGGGSSSAAVQLEDFDGRATRTRTTQVGGQRGGGGGAAAAAAVGGSGQRKQQLLQSTPALDSLGAGRAAGSDETAGTEARAAVAAAAADAAAADAATAAATAAAAEQAAAATAAAGGGSVSDIRTEQEEEEEEDDPFEIGIVRRRMVSRNAERQTAAERAERMEAALQGAAGETAALDDDGAMEDDDEDEEARAAEARAAEARRFFREVEVDEMTPPSASSFSKKGAGSSSSRRKGRGAGGDPEAQGRVEEMRLGRESRRAAAAAAAAAAREDSDDEDDNDDLTVKTPMIDDCVAGPTEEWFVVDDGGSVHFRHAPRMEARVMTVRAAARGELLQGAAEACNLPAGWVQIRPVKGEPGLGKGPQAPCTVDRHRHRHRSRQPKSLDEMMLRAHRFDSAACCWPVLASWFGLVAGGLWLPKQFLLTPRAYEMAGLFDQQQRQQRQQRQRQKQARQQQATQQQQQPPPAPPPPPPAPPAPPPSAAPTAGAGAGAGAQLDCVDDKAGLLKVGTCAANALHPGCDFDLHTLHGGVLYGPEFAGVTVADLCPKTCGRCSG